MVLEIIHLLENSEDLQNHQLNVLKRLNSLSSLEFHLKIGSMKICKNVSLMILKQKLKTRSTVNIKTLKICLIKTFHRMVISKLIMRSNWMNLKLLKVLKQKEYSWNLHQLRKASFNIILCHLKLQFLRLLTSKQLKELKKGMIQSHNLALHKLP